VDLVDRIVSGEVLALARAISLVEEDAAGAADVLREAFRHAGRATVLGVTGPPGAGKSSLVDRLVASYRKDGNRVGVVAVDPTSAYSGGAILGDRVRMQGHATDPGVFIRSMASRGFLGGLSRATNDALDLLDSAGFDPVLVETVGVGQDEIDVAKAADVVMVVLVPGMGDDIQAIKAGILEIADVFVINKADRPGADRVAADLEYMMSLSPQDGRPKPEIVRTVATQNEGIEDLRAAIARLAEGPARERRASRRRERAEARFLSVLSERLVSLALSRALAGGALERYVEEIADRKLDPYSAADRVVAAMEVR
jgi:LAO/AO transport system kinase